MGLVRQEQDHSGAHFPTSPPCHYLTGVGWFAIQTMWIPISLSARYFDLRFSWLGGSIISTFMTRDTRGTHQGVEVAWVSQPKGVFIDEVGQTT